MANVYDRRRHHQLLHHKTTTIFLPIFCRLSLKDINLSRRRRRESSLSDEPSSPKVSCMGQIKRNHRVIGLPAAAATPTAAHQHKYSKLKKLFSGKTLLPPITTSLPTATLACAAAPSTVGGGRSGSKSCRSSKEVCVDNLRRLKLKKDCDRGDYVKVIDVGELDPPLPVLKRVAPPGNGREEVNLWKRRFNGAAQIEKIHLPNCKISQPPTV